MQRQKKLVTYFIIPIIALAGLAAAGISFFVLKNPNLGNKILLAALAAGTLPLVFRIARDIFAGRFGVDIIAILAIASSFILGQYLAGTVILLMLSGGEALEVYAQTLARKNLSSLISNAPSLAHIKTPAGLKDVPALEVAVGDAVLIKPGEAVPVDGLVTQGRSEMDEAALTGESLPVKKHSGSLVLAGSINKDSPVEIQTIRTAKDSKYEQIIRLVREAEESRAPIVRLADRYSVWFTAVTLVFAAAAWLLSRDPIRLLAVLVVATPCPLILATPIAMISGISRAAGRGIIIKNGGALETLAGVKAFIFDKTGTLTLGQPKLAKLEAISGSAQQLLAVAASLDQLSGHILARSLVDYAKAQNTALYFPRNFRESFGDGVSGEINGKKYLFGRLRFLQINGVQIPPAIKKQHEAFQQQGSIAVYLGEAASGLLLGAVLFSDHIRPEIKSLFRKIAAQGVNKIVMLTGDKNNVAQTIARQAGLSDVHSECLPEDKVWEVKDHQRQFGPVAMVGDGVNDAPALAAADVGIAMGGQGSTASQESADMVITVDSLERVEEAFRFSKRVVKVAKQGIFTGMAASIVLMVIAALGHITPVYGAVIQEILDVGVILNALRIIL